MKNEIKMLVKSMRVMVRKDAFSGSDVYDVKGLEEQEFDVIALAQHIYEDKSQTAVAFLDTPTGIREVALSHLMVISKESAETGA